ncbi:MAG: hypothetical protein ACOC9Y_00515 [Chloroflexota bacterium]
MPVGPFEALLILFCCGVLFGLPVAAIILYLIRRSRVDQTRQLPRDEEEY